MHALHVPELGVMLLFMYAYYAFKFAPAYVDTVNSYEQNYNIIMVCSVNNCLIPVCMLTNTR